MYFLWKYYYLIIIILLSLLSFLFNIYFPHEAFAMEPPKDWIIDHYGNKQYVGPDAYGYFNNHGFSNNYSETVKSDLGPSCTTQIEDEFTSHNENNSEFTLYLAIKRRTYWYIWKIHSTEYNSYKDFKRAWNPNSSFRKDFFNDIKKAFLRRK